MADDGKHTHSEDVPGEDPAYSDHHHYKYMTVDDIKSLRDDSAQMDVTRDEHDNYRESYVTNSDVMAQLHVKEQFALNSSQPDNVDIIRTPVHVGKGQWTNFLVSFLVDARGGAMRGCRRSGVNVVVPPRAAAAPLRLTCRYIRHRPTIAPPLSEAQALATRVLELSPAGTKFLGPIIIEVPHFVSLRGKERELVVMRSDNGTTWKEHSLEESQSAVQHILNHSFEGDGVSDFDELHTNRVLRIVTTELPQYFAVVSRLRQEVHAIGPEGGVVSSTAVPQVQAIFPPNALTKKIKVGLQAQPISCELVSRLLGNRVGISPIVTVEPRRRKFHKPITLTLPVPTTANKGMINQYTGDAPTLRLLCSITGGNAKAQWEDVTGSTPLTLVKDCVSFTTTVSARFWLMDCRHVSSASSMASQLYNQAIHVPFMAKFVVYAKRINFEEARLRVFIMTDDREDKTLEHQEHFTEVAKSRDVEVLEGKPLFLEFAGNLIPVTKSGEQLSINFVSFKENRLPFTVRLRDLDTKPTARLLFMPQPKLARGEPGQIAVCTLNISLPEDIVKDGTPYGSDLCLSERSYSLPRQIIPGRLSTDTVVRGNLVLSEVSRLVGEDWRRLALGLGLNENDVQLITSEGETDRDRADLAIALWRNNNGIHATGNWLEKVLRDLGREDVVEKSVRDRRLVTDDTERAVASMTLDQSGFDSLSAELGKPAHPHKPEEVCEVQEVSSVAVEGVAPQGKYDWEEKSITAEFLAHETSTLSADTSIISQNGTNGLESSSDWKNNSKNVWRSPSSERFKDGRGQMSSDSESGLGQEERNGRQGRRGGSGSRRRKQPSSGGVGSSSGSDVALHEGLSDSDHGSDLPESLPHNGSHSEINQVTVSP